MTTYQGAQINSGGKRCYKRPARPISLVFFETLTNFAEVMVNYKFTYFNLRGFGEPARLLFHLSHTPFEDDRIEFEDWLDRKPSTPFGKVPLLEIDGVVYNQSLAITRYLAHKFGHGGKDLEEQLLVDSWAEQQRQFFMDSHSAYSGAVRLGKPAEEQEKLLKELEAALPEWYTKITDQIKKAGSGFIAPSGITYADLWIADHITSLHKALPKILEEHSEIANYHKRVHEIPEIAQYITTRPDTAI
ncbi:unnamed protein product [Caenorhabditis auriculariae]|uniref:Glutathione S-transferase n=1 Tax=Caenorhabditis auriculariae TaxID=2777116 RepID=A0A8S1HT62_9PELO|nr:unnamed protein product [Caenorhabditis auriculariae]